MVALLIEAGAEVDARGAGRTALHAAVQQERPDLAELLLRGGADPDIRLERRLPRVAGQLANTGGRLTLIGATPFWLAAKFADPEMMRLLADHGADTTSTNADGTTPLMAAAGIGWLDGSDRYGRVAFDADRARRERRSLEAVQLAAALGGDVHAVDEHGQTALHGAAWMGGDAIARHLAGLGARLDVTDAAGRTPLSIAEGQFYGGAFVVRESTATLLRRLGGVR